MRNRSMAGQVGTLASCLFISMIIAMLLVMLQAPTADLTVHRHTKSEQVADKQQQDALLSMAEPAMARPQIFLIDREEIVAGLLDEEDIGNTRFLLVSEAVFRIGKTTRNSNTMFLHLPVSDTRRGTISTTSLNGPLTIQTAI